MRLVELHNEAELFGEGHACIWACCPYCHYRRGLLTEFDVLTKKDRQLLKDEFAQWR
jgi:hypothetical protein